MVGYQVAYIPIPELHQSFVCAQIFPSMGYYLQSLQGAERNV